MINKQDCTLFLDLLLNSSKCIEKKIKKILFRKELEPRYLFLCMQLVIIYQMCLNITILFPTVL